MHGISSVWYGLNYILIHAACVSVCLLVTQGSPSVKEAICVIQT